MKRAVISVTNDLVSDQRIHRTADVLKGCGYDVLLIGRKLKNSLKYKGPYFVKRFKLLFNKGPLFYAEYNIRLFCFLIFKNPDLYFANDADTLLPNFLVSRFHGQKIIYDSHEFFTGVPELLDKNLVKKFWKTIERFCLPKIENIITVSQGVSDLYHKEYGVNMEVVRNLPFSIYETKTLEIPEIRNRGVVIYQGALNKDRGLELMIKTMRLLKDNVFLVLGDGDIKKELKHLASQEGVSDRVLFIGKKSHIELPSYTKLADVGISLEEDTNLNYRFALPNKMFDYIMSGVPVVVSNLPEMSKVVNEYGVGEVLFSRKEEDLAVHIERVIKQKDTYKEKLKTASASLCWEKESGILRRIIESLDDKCCN